MVYKIPLILPHIAVAFLVLVFWTKSGFVSSICFHLGWVQRPGDFPSVVYGGTGLGMILAYLYKETPFVILLAWAVLKRLDPRLIQTAYMLGAGRWRVFRRVVLPHMRHVLHTTFIILFLYGFGAFDIPFLVGESSPGMLSIEAFNLYFRRSLADRPRGPGHPGAHVRLFRRVHRALHAPGVTPGQGGEEAVRHRAFFTLLCVLFALPLGVLALYGAAPGWRWPELFPSRPGRPGSGVRLGAAGGASRAPGARPRPFPWPWCC